MVLSNLSAQIFESQRMKNPLRAVVVAWLALNIVINCFIIVGASFLWEWDCPWSQKLCFRNLLMAIPQSKALCHRWQKPFLILSCSVQCFYIPLHTHKHLWFSCWNVPLMIFMTTCWSTPKILITHSWRSGDPACAWSETEWAVGWVWEKK